MPQFSSVPHALAQHGGAGDGLDEWHTSFVTSFVISFVTSVTTFTPSVAHITYHGASALRVHFSKKLHCSSGTVFPAFKAAAGRDLGKETRINGMGLNKSSVRGRGARVWNWGMAA